ncbi:hypothetical protein WMZ97_06175 [Lentibacillus sp. N15]|uniref:hypothetical protein n=1 Tax=Lentibacillus songyuanensis TaxID=3136161 RepID=UPI0031BAD1D7
MRKKKVMVLFAASLMLFAMGCSNEANKEEDNQKQGQHKYHDNNESGKVKDTTKSQAEMADDEELQQFFSNESLGEYKVIGEGYNDELGIDGNADTPLKPVKLGPIRLTIESVKVLEVKPSNDVIGTIFDNDEIAQVVVAKVKIHSTTDELMEFHADTSKLTTDTGEEVFARMVNDDVWDEFDGTQEKEGYVLWVLDTPDKKIQNMQMTIYPPIASMEFKEMGEEKQINVDVASNGS